MLYKFKYLFGWLISNNNNKTFIIAVGCWYLEIFHFFSRIKYSPAFLTDNKDVKLISAFHVSSPGCSTGGWMDGSGSSGGKRFSHKLFFNTFHWLRKPTDRHRRWSIVLVYVRKTIKIVNWWDIRVVFNRSVFFFSFICIMVLHHLLPSTRLTCGDSTM